MTKSQTVTHSRRGWWSLAVLRDPQSDDSGTAPLCVRESQCGGRWRGVQDHSRCPWRIVASHGSVKRSQNMKLLHNLFKCQNSYCWFFIVFYTIDNVKIYISILTYAQLPTQLTYLMPLWFYYSCGTAYMYLPINDVWKQSQHSSNQQWNHTLFSFFK